MLFSFQHRLDSDASSSRPTFLSVLDAEKKVQRNMDKHNVRVAFEVNCDDLDSLVLIGSHSMGFIHRYLAIESADT